MLRGRILPFLFNPKSRKENVGTLAGEYRGKEREREKGRTISSSCRHNTGLAPRPLYALQRRTMAGKGVSWYSTTSLEAVMYPGSVLYLPLPRCDSWTKATEKEALLPPVLSFAASLIIFPSLAAIATYVSTAIYSLRINIILQRWIYNPSISSLYIYIYIKHSQVKSWMVSSSKLDSFFFEERDSNRLNSKEITISSMYIYIYIKLTLVERRRRRIAWMAVASTFPTPKGVSKDVVHAVGSQV